MFSLSAFVLHRIQKQVFYATSLPEVLSFLDNNIWYMHHEEIILSCIIFITEELSLKSV